MAEFHNKSTERLFKAIMSLKDAEECKALFEDLCTIKEIQDMAQRLDTAVLLNNGMSYQKIAQETGMSTATISRVNKCLLYGSNGYKTVIKRMAENDNDNK